jgi:P-type Cu+ transporter
MTEVRAIRESLGAAVAASALLLSVYVSVIALGSGWSYAQSELARFWPYLLPLSVGFGIQVGLYWFLRRLLSEAHASRNALAASGTSSTVAMMSCCAHYVLNLAPVLGAAGVLAFLAQYQIELFWVGMGFNAAGIAFIGSRVAGAVHAHRGCVEGAAA